MMTYIERIFKQILWEVEISQQKPLARKNRGHSRNSD